MSSVFTIDGAGLGGSRRRRGTTKHCANGFRKGRVCRKRPRKSAGSGCKYGRTKAGTCRKRPRR